MPLSPLINWYYTFICPIEVFGYRPTQLNHNTKYRSKSCILPTTNRRVVQPVTWRDRLITAVIQLLFKLGGRIRDLGQNICHLCTCRCFKWILLYVAFCTIMAISRKKEGTMPYSYRITSRVLYSAQCHRHHCTLHAFEQFGALYRHNLDD